MTESRGSASFKRAEQLKRWEDSETNRQPSSPKAPSRITFSLDCVFLAACSAGDKAEVLRLVQSGADVNTSSVDGLTALHQACIDARLDMVEFLIQLGANVNHSDNEGWTPLHATASCGFVSIARYLLDMGARIAAVNNEGELPVDIAEKGPMKDFLQEEIDKAGIDCDKARNEEEQILLEDAKCWCSTQSPDAELGDERTGATPLHIAAAKGYVKVMCLLLGNCLVDVDPVDFDGWTPLHASAHWGQPEAATILVQHGADMDVKNYVGQTCFDVAVSSMINHLKQLKDQSQNPLAAQKKRRPNIPDDLPSKLKKIDVQIESKPKIDTLNNKKTIDWDSSTSSDFSDSESDISSEDNHKDYNMSDEEIGEKQNNVTTQPQSDGDIILRRTHSCETDKTFYQRYQALTARIKASSLPLIPAPEPANDPALLRSASLKDTPLTTHHYRQEKQKKEVTSPPNPPNVRRSFVPPVRDEESETQRKAHAKRVRETRRSTQGVTLDEIKSAEQLVKKKNGPTKPEAIPPPAEPVRPPTQPPVVPTATEDNEISGKNSSAAVRLPLHRTSNNDISVTIATAPTTVAKATTPVVTATIDAEPIPTGGPERRPSWRLRVDPGCKFALEDDTQQPAETEVNEISETATTVTVPLRRTTPQTNNKEEEKENESRGATQAAQNVIQRRRRPKRRSTGVVDVDDLITDRNNDGESGSESNEQSASEKPSANDEESAEIDYKALWEESQIEIKKLNAIIAEIEKKLEEDRGTIEKYASMAARSSLTETEKREKREKRAMERRLSEMEEELKFQQALQVENQRLKDENGALIRVISKLSK